ncbi:PREDICTED: uncharacterized protein LOC106337749 [Brassica oleracea var. oleracea]|uniref:uncharacterized protein LOC106337749 n=1 Tax=Brassica oleracea var. oleracea TaxID=109376 RepID=UPI0006A705B7|nr:PREDICTED: uncharacterized protein LOC106337749 [Brassica oleracea var. oleracea]
MNSTSLLIKSNKTDHQQESSTTLSHISTSIQIYHNQTPWDKIRYSIWNLHGDLQSHVPIYFTGSEAYPVGILECVKGLYGNKMLNEVIDSMMMRYTVQVLKSYRWKLGFFYLH